MSDNEATCARCGLVGPNDLVSLAGPHPLHECIRLLRSELSRLRLDGIHSCHDQCPREACVLRRENERLNALVNRQHDALVEYIGPDWDIDASPQTLADQRRMEQEALTASEQRAEREAERAKVLEKGAERLKADLAKEREAVFSLGGRCSTLSVAMDRYGRHLQGCPAIRAADCQCGMNDIKAARADLRAEMAKEE